MIRGSRDAQNRCVPVIPLFNAVMLIGLWKSLPWPTRSNRELRTRQKLEVVFALNKNRAGSACGANDSADRCSLPTAGDGADDSSDSRGNACR